MVHRWLVGRRFSLLLLVVYGLLATEALTVGRAAGRFHGDSHSYLRLAHSVAQGHGMVEEMKDGSLTPNLIRPPGYPVFLAVVGNLLGDPVDGPIAVQIVLLCVSLEIVRRQVERLRGRGASLLVPALAALTPSFLFHAGRISSETPALALHMVALAIALRPSSGAVAAGAAGVLLGAAALFRQNLLVVPLQLGLADCLRRRRVWAPAVILVLAAAVTVLPWAERNRRVGGIFSPVSAMPEQYRFTYYRDLVMADDALTGSRRMDRFGPRLGALREKYGLPRPTSAEHAMTNGVAVGSVDRTHRLLRDVNAAARESAAELGWPRILAWRLVYFFPRTWITSPMTYPATVPAWVRYVLAGIQAAVLVVGALALRSALGAPMWTLVGGLMALGALEVAWHNAGTVIGLLALAVLAARVRAPDLLVPATWAAVTALLAVVMIGRHTEFRHVVPHYPLLIGLVAWEAGRWRWVSRLTGCSDPGAGPVG
jgi:hypothetical protein